MSLSPLSGRYVLAFVRLYENHFHRRVRLALSALTSNPATSRWIEAPLKQRRARCIRHLPFIRNRLEGKSYHENPVARRIQAAPRQRRPRFILTRSKPAPDASYAASGCAENGFGAKLDTPPLTRPIARTCEQLGLAIGTSDGGGQVLSRDAAKRRKGLSEIKKSLSAIARHGGHTLFTVLGPDDPSMSKAETFEIFAKVYPRVVAHAEKVGVNIAIEPWPGGRPHYPNLGCSPESLRLIFAACPSPRLGICYDPSHFVRLQIDYQRLLHEFGDRVRHVHLRIPDHA